MRAVLAMALAGLVLSSSALGSASFTDVGVTNATLAVNSAGEALVTYTRANGSPRHVLVWGAVNALAPDSGAPQLSFHFDYAGGWRAHKNASYWKTFKNACLPYDGPQLADVVAACKAPDGSYWALQSWQRKLPHRGVDPWTPDQAAASLQVSHWTGDLASVEIHVDWPQTFNDETEQIFGRMTYAGQPVHGFRTTANGAPTDGYGRGLYIDTLDSAYGPGWKRETSIVFRNPTGSFCYSFYPTNDVSLPGRPSRPAGNGSRYRITVMGPGVTPDVVAEADAIGKYSGSSSDVALERDRLALYDQITGGDKFCATQR
jgi:hypothetical protein